MAGNVIHFFYLMTHLTGRRDFLPGSRGLAFAKCFSKKQKMKRGNANEGVLRDCTGVTIQE